MIIAVFLFLGLVTGIGTDLSHETLQDSSRAREIFEEVERRQDVVRTEISLQDMQITDHRGRTRTRVMKTWSRRDADTEERDQLIVFTDPGSVRGSAFLTLNREDQDLQKLYLPGVGRIQTIQTDQSGDSFMGSDFTYEDFSSQQSEEYRFLSLGELEQQGTAFWVILAEKTEPFEKDRYQSLRFYVEKETYAIHRVDYLTATGDEVRRLTSEGFLNQTGNLWSPTKMTMQDLERGSQTTIEWKERELNPAIEDWRFTERGLERGL